jgi:hypothetical protein
MKTVDQTLEQLDNTLDRVEELIRELPISDARKRQLASMVYDLWMEVEGDMELRPADFG